MKMKHFILIFLTVMIHGHLFAQISIKIDSIKIENGSALNKKQNNEDYAWHVSDMIRKSNFYISIKNETADFLYLYYEQVQFGYLYYYDENLYNGTFFMFINPFDHLLLVPEETVSIELYNALRLDHLEEYGRDSYYLDITKIIPTIRVFIIFSNTKEIIFSEKCEKGTIEINRDKKYKRVK